MTAATAAVSVDPARSNSLADLAARIRTEHEAVSSALKDSVRHAIAAGELLHEAKSNVAHGQWLPWLRERCSISERTAQLYMRCARNRSAIEEQIRNGIADLTLNEAAVLMLSSDVRKLLEFAKSIENADPETLMGVCAAHGIAVIGNPFGAKEWDALPNPEQVEWSLWTLFGVKEFGDSAEEASYHAERLQTRGWILSDWYGDKGDDYRARCCLRRIPQSTKDHWVSFLETNQHRTLDDVTAEIDRLEAARVENLTTHIKAANSRRRRRS